MTKQLLTVFFAIISFNCIAQINFESGYFINNDNQKTECLIKNVDWKSNPTQFDYKLFEGADVSTETIKNVKEFGVYNSSKFIRATVNMDRASVNLPELSRDKNPVFKLETLFLRVLVEGDYNLYEYSEGNLRRYFYNTKDSEIEQLVYKLYSTDLIQASKNNTYQQQLWNDLKCPSITLKKIQRLEYKKDYLLEFFKEYNQCHNSESTYVQPKKERNIIDLTIRPRLNSSSLFVDHKVLSKYKTDFDNELDFGFGLEFEFYLPYNKNKWSVLVEPTYQTYKTEKVTGTKSNFLAEVNYTSIEVPVGLRHYTYLNEKSKLFLNVTFSYSFRLDSSITFTRDDNREVNKLVIDPNKNFAFGAGYKYNDRFSAEIRYNSRHILDNYYDWNTSFKSTSFILGYTIF